MIEEQGDQPAVRIDHPGRQRGEAELAARFGIGPAREQEACSVEPTVRAGYVQQGLAALIPRVGGHAVIEHAAESGSVADARVEERGPGERDCVTSRSGQRARFRHAVFLDAPPSPTTHSAPIFPVLSAALLPAEALLLRGAAVADEVG